MLAVQGIKGNSMGDVSHRLASWRFGFWRWFLECITEFGHRKGAVTISEFLQHRLSERWRSSVSVLSSTVIVFGLPGYTVAQWQAADFVKPRCLQFGGLFSVLRVEQPDLQTGMLQSLVGCLT